MSREERLRARIELVADNLDKDSSPWREFEDTLEFGNSWSVVWDDLIKMMLCYQLKQEGSYYGKPWGLLDRNALIDLMAKTLFDRTEKDFTPRSDNTIYVYEFEAEHDGDVRGICEELSDAGAEIVKTKVVLAEETAYAFFKVKSENVERFEGKFGKLWRFNTV